MVRFCFVFSGGRGSNQISLGYQAITIKKDCDEAERWLIKVTVRPQHNSAAYPAILALRVRSFNSWNLTQHLTSEFVLVVFLMKILDKTWCDYSISVCFHL